MHGHDKLSLGLKLAEGQTLSSFVSALAAHNGFRSSIRLCKAFDIDASQLGSEHSGMLDRLAFVSSNDVDRLRNAGNWFNGSTYRYCSQRLERSQLRPAAHVCPQCLEEDQRACPDMRDDAAARDRAAWGHALVQVCTIHNLELVPLPSPNERSAFRHDLAAQLRALTAPLKRIEASPNAVDHYITARFARSTTHIDILDDLELDDAIFLARYLGTPWQNGMRPAAPFVLDDAIRRIEQGLAIAVQGKDCVEARLLEIASIINPHGACEIGLRRVFRPLIDRLQRGDQLDMPAVRNLLVSIGIHQNLFPFAQTEALGLPLPARRAETVEAARKRFGISDRVMRAILNELGVLPVGHSEHHSNAILVDLEEFAPLLGELKDCLNLVQAGSAVGLHSSQLLKLSNHSGVIQPFFTRPSSDLKPLRYFRKIDLDRFMMQVTRNCTKVMSATGLVDVWEGALKACRQPSDLIAAIADGRVGRTFRVGKVQTIRDLLVSLDDVRAAMAQKFDDNLISAEDCARTMSVNVQAMRMIMQSGILRSEIGTNPVNQRGQLSVRQIDLTKFKQEFISLTSIRQDWNTTGPGMATALREVGVMPAFSIKLSGVGLYRRAEVTKARAKIDMVMGQRQARYC